MKTVNLLIISGVICALFQMTGCSSGKSASSFKQLKKQSDTLIILGPYLKMMVLDKEETKTDPELESSNKEIISGIIKEVLASKYKLKAIDLPQPERSKLNELFLQLDKSGKAINGISASPLIQDYDRPDGKRLAMIIDFQAEFNPAFVPYHNLNVAMNTNNVQINPSIKPRSYFRLLLIDLASKEIVFYDKYSTRNYDPRIASDVGKITKSLLRPVYYK